MQKLIIWNCHSFLIHTHTDQTHFSRWNNGFKGFFHLHFIRHSIFFIYFVINRLVDWNFSLCEYIRYIWFIGFELNNLNRIDFFFFKVNQNSTVFLSLLLSCRQTNGRIYWKLALGFFFFFVWLTFFLKEKQQQQKRGSFSFDPDIEREILHMKPARHVTVYGNICSIHSNIHIQ